jgi:ABC-type Fe3+ transport system permease subunit
VEHVVGGVLVVAITLLLGVPAAYALARLDRPWASWFGISIFLVYLVPPTLLFLSLSADGGGARAAGLHLVAGAGVPDDHDPGVDLAAHRAS